MCDTCKWVQAVLLGVIIIVSLWPGLLGQVVSLWLTVIFAVMLFAHLFFCKRCNCCEAPVKIRKSKSRRR